jgi:hypothetical protein
LFTGGSVSTNAAAPQHRAVPGAQIFDRVLVSDQFLEPRVEVVGVKVGHARPVAAHQQSFRTAAAALQCPHGPDHLRILDQQSAAHPALGRVVDRLLLQRDVLAQQRRDPVGVVLLGILVAARPEVADIE